MTFAYIKGGGQGVPVFGSYFAADACICQGYYVGSKIHVTTINLSYEHHQSVQYFRSMGSPQTQQYGRFFGSDNCREWFDLDVVF